MKKLLTISIALALSACASPPKPEVPSPYGRKPINSEAAIQEYREQSASESALRKERNELQRQLQAMQQQLEELRAYFIMYSADQATEIQPARPAAAEVPEKTEGMSGTPAATNKTSALDDSKAAADGQMIIGTDSVEFRVFQRYAATDFEPAREMADAILRAARSSESVIIRGRTDSNYADDSNQRIALARGLAARQYLIENGVSPSKIRVYYSSTGDFIADNSTTAGRAMNRRVELEARGVDVTSFKVSTTI